VRLSKIEKHALFILRNEEHKDRLSAQEIQYAQQYQELVENHYQNSFLNELPPNQRRLDDKFGDSSMIVTPDLDNAVICKVKKDIGEFQLQSSDDESIMMQRDNIYILRYRDVRRLLELESIDLI